MITFKNHEFKEFNDRRGRRKKALIIHYNVSSEKSITSFEYYVRCVQGGRMLHGVDPSIQRQIEMIGTADILPDVGSGETVQCVQSFSLESEEPVVLSSNGFSRTIEVEQK